MSPIRPIRPIGPIRLIGQTKTLPKQRGRWIMAQGIEQMDLDQLAAYLRRDVREVAKMVSRGHVPGRKVGGEWRFAKAEINQWIETQLPNYTDTQLTTLETTGDRSLDQGPLVATLLSEATSAVPLAASTKASVLKELVQLAEQTWQVYDPEAVL